MDKVLPFVRRKYHKKSNCWLTNHIWIGYFCLEMTCIKSLFRVEQSHCKCYDELKQAGLMWIFFPFLICICVRVAVFQIESHPIFWVMLDIIFFYTNLYSFVLGVILFFTYIYHTHFILTFMMCFKWLTWKIT